MENMNINNTDKKAELHPMPVYMLEGMPYVPHYIKPYHWVAPGGVTRTTTWLEERHAKQVMRPLWMRTWVLERFVETTQDL